MIGRSRIKKNTIWKQVDAIGLLPRYADRILA